MIKLYEHPRCSTCKKALKFLETHKIDVAVLDIRTIAPSKVELKQMLEHVGGEVKKLFNTSGIQYRELDLKTRLATMSVEEAIQVLNSNGMLVKRPFLLAKDFGLVGFKEDLWKEALC
jgi:arsenate reductase